MPDEPTTQELKLDQLRREDTERRAADEHPTDPGTRAHGRRAEKAAYLADKLAERERSERDVAADDADRP